VNTGDIINVDGFGAKNGTNTANAASVTLAATGELLWASVPRSGQEGAANGQGAPATSPR
jgi:hypothetical protein